MEVKLSKHLEVFIQKLIASGRYENASEVICAGLKNLERDESSLRYPPGSLLHLYTRKENSAERQTLKR